MSQIIYYPCPLKIIFLFHSTEADNESNLFQITYNISPMKSEVVVCSPVTFLSLLFHKDTTVPLLAPKLLCVMYVH